MLKCDSVEVFCLRLEEKNQRQQLCDLMARRQGKVLRQGKADAECEDDCELLGPRSGVALTSGRHSYRIHDQRSMPSSSKGPWQFNNNWKMFCNHMSNFRIAWPKVSPLKNHPDLCSHVVTEVFVVPVAIVQRPARCTTTWWTLFLSIHSWMASGCGQWLVKKTVPGLSHRFVLL